MNINKSLLAVFLFGISFFNDASAVSCYASRADGGDMAYDYIVYFKHDYPKPNSREFCPSYKPVNEDGCCGTDVYNSATKLCDGGNSQYLSIFADMATDLTDGSYDCAKDLRYRLNEIPVDSDTRILLLATADKTGAHVYNDALSDRRLNTVQQLFGPQYQDKIITHLAGETNDNFTGTTGRNQYERTVRIFVGGTNVINEIIQQVSVSASRSSDTTVVIKGNATTAEQRIKKITSELNGLVQDLGASVWKTKEGNFNGARLASDSIAGVVLGTAGGLITSNVIKKNQIKGGFEDIKCTVGGQIVSEFGDDFVVGIR